MPVAEPGSARTYGLLAEFDSPEALLAAARRTWAEGFRRVDAFTPFPIEGLAETIGFRESRVPALTLLGGLFGAALGYGMQVYVNLDYPLNAGGRPLLAPPAFLLITFELLVLFAVLFSIGGMLVLNRLPRLHHPLFAIEAFDLASSDKFFLVICSSDDRFDLDKTRRFLADLRPVTVEDVPLPEAAQ